MTELVTLQMFGIKKKIKNKVARSTPCQKDDSNITTFFDWIGFLFNGIEQKNEGQRKEQERTSFSSPGKKVSFVFIGRL